MSVDAAFLAAIKMSPNDDTTRLVYADWLDEHSLPGGEFLRIDCKIAALDPAEFEERQRIRDILRDEPGFIDSATYDPTDNYSYQRSWLLASLRVASQGLSEDWIRAVSRAPIEELNARVREIQSWLKRRVEVHEFLAQTHEDPTGIKEWIDSNMQSGDALWEYDTGPESWNDLCGEMGYAIVRSGKVIEFIMLMMN